MTTCADQSPLAATSAEVLITADLRPDRPAPTSPPRRAAGVPATLVLAIAGRHRYRCRWPVPPVVRQFARHRDAFMATPSRLPRTTPRRRTCSIPAATPAARSPAPGAAAAARRMTDQRRWCAGLRRTPRWRSKPTQACTAAATEVHRDYGVQPSIASGEPGARIATRRRSSRRLSRWRPASLVTGFAAAASHGAAATTAPACSTAQPRLTATTACWSSTPIHHRAVVAANRDEGVHRRGRRWRRSRAATCSASMPTCSRRYLVNDLKVLGLVTNYWNASCSRTDRVARRPCPDCTIRSPQRYLDRPERQDYTANPLPWACWLPMQHAFNVQNARSASAWCTATTSIPSTSCSAQRVPGRPALPWMQITPRDARQVYGICANGAYRCPGHPDLADAEWSARLGRRLRPAPRVRHPLPGPRAADRHDGSLGGQEAMIGGSAPASVNGAAERHHRQPGDGASLGNRPYHHRGTDGLRREIFAMA